MLAGQLVQTLEPQRLQHQVVAVSGGPLHRLDQPALELGPDRATSATVTVDGVDLASLPPRRLTAYWRTVGFVFQRFHPLPALNVLDIPSRLSAR